MYHANAALNIATDLLVAALPIRRLWKLQLPLRQKIAIVSILTIGWLYVYLPPNISFWRTLTTTSVVIISVIRLYILIQVAKHPEDTTWYSAPAAYWSAIEVNLAIVCASAPALKPLVVQVMPKFGSRFGTGRRPSENIVPLNGTHDSSGNGPFMRLKAKPSHSTMNDDVYLESGVTAVPPIHRSADHDNWKEIHVTRGVEQCYTNR